MKPYLVLVSSFHRADIRDDLGVVVFQPTGEDVVLATVVRRDHHAKVAMKENIEGGEIANAAANVVLDRSGIPHEKVSGSRRHQLHQPDCALVGKRSLIPAGFLLDDRVHQLPGKVVMVRIGIRIVHRFRSSALWMRHSRGRYTGDEGPEE